MVKCQICGKEFVKARSMANHRRWHKIPRYEKFQERYIKSITGRKRTEEQIKRFRLAHKGKHNHLKINPPFLGKHHSEETRKKISSKLKGKPSPNKGIPCSEETKRRISKANKGKLAGIKHPRYGNQDYILTIKNILNNPMKKPENRKKQLESLKKSYREGRIKSWNKGLTRNDDERVAKLVDNPKFIQHQFKKGHTLSRGAKRSKECKLKLRLGRLGKKNPEHSKKVSKEKNPNWQGGKMYEPYTPDFDRKFKESIRRRDGYECVNNLKSQEVGN